jgi:tetratricopeptide (TPR) repeat protein
MADRIARSAAANQARHANELGTACARQARYDQAIAHYRRALALDPTLAEACNNLGNIRRLQGDLAAASDCYRRCLAMRPDFLMAHDNLGITLLQAGRPEEAAASHRRALALDPASAVSHFNLGNVLLSQNDTDGAAACYQIALALAPGNASALLNLGNALRLKGDTAGALGCYTRAAALRPDDPVAHHNLGNMLLELDRVEESISCQRRALALRPDYVEAHLNLGNALHFQGRHAEALDCYQRAASHRPDGAEAHVNIGNALQGMGRFADALESYRHAGAIRPDDPGAHVNAAFMLLLRGDLCAGWREYEWRLRLPHAATSGLRMPPWRGEALAGRSILLLCEQGLGDSLQFIRYARLVKARGAAEVALACPPPLARLFATLAGLDRICTDWSDLPACDVHAPLLSLPHLFATTLQTIPGPVPYLAPQPEAASRWAARLAGLPGRKVGLVWAGNPRLDQGNAHRIDRRRSMRLADFATLADVLGVTFVSLQKGAPADQPGLNLVDWMAEVEDFADTAALVANLDLVIGVDTSVVHLAGAMGKPVWVLSRFDGCWRWLLDRDDSPWYPTLRLFRQQSFGDWAPVVASVRAALGQFAAG